jgi:hypothetical protein
MPAQSTLSAITAHGAARLPSVDLNSYNIELRDDEGLIGDRASKGALRNIIENWRSALRKLGADPLGEDTSEELTKKKFDKCGGNNTRRHRGVLAGIRACHSPLPQIRAC